MVEFFPPQAFGWVGDYIVTLEMANPAYDHYASEYARFRPGYEAKTLSCITARTGDPAGRIALDVGCGNGQLSAALAQIGWRVIALDASVEMLKAIPPTTMPIIHPIRSVAEHLPLVDDSASLVTCAQSIHWFNPRYAIGQFGRVLQTGGWLVLMWQDMCPTDPFCGEFTEWVRQWAPSFERPDVSQDWCVKLRSSGHFEHLSDIRLNRSWRPTLDDFVGYVHTLSFLRNTIPKTSWPALDAELRTKLSSHFGEGPCRMSMQIRFIFAQRR